uniref:Uncharacterized protein n=1 Tax=Cannabis sativa TaxID=3483 RepID=A0A803QMP2_CANSA
MVSEELRPSASMARPTTRSQDGSAPSTINNNTTEVNSDSIPAPPSSAVPRRIPPVRVQSQNTDQGVHDNSTIAEDNSTQTSNRVRLLMIIPARSSSAPATIQDGRPLEKQVVDAWRMAMQNNRLVGFVNEVPAKDFSIAISWWFVFLELCRSSTTSATAFSQQQHQPSLQQQHQFDPYTGATIFSTPILNQA